MMASLQSRQTAILPSQIMNLYFPVLREILGFFNQTTKLQECREQEPQLQQRSLNRSTAT